MSESSFNTFAPLFETLCHTDIKVGSLKDMKRQHIKTVSAYEESQLKDLLQTRLGPVSTISDSTPGAAEAEGVIIRFVNKTFQVVQVLVDLRYFDKKLNGSNIAYNLVRVLSKWGVDIENQWKFAIADRAATNKRAINLLLEMTAVKVVDWPCHAHTLCKPGDELTKATPNATFLE